MNQLGWRAFLRAVSIVGCVALLKYAVDFVLETNNPKVQILYSIGALVTILLIFVLTNAISGNTLSSFLDGPISKYVIIITSIISVLLIAQAIVDGTNRDGRFLSLADKQLAMNFVEWFGVLYGFLLPTILVRVWEQFDQIDNVLDREADSIKSLVGDLLLLDIQYDTFKKEILCSLYEYSLVFLRFINKKIPYSREVKRGDQLLKRIRGYYVEVFRRKPDENEGTEVLKDELLTQLNNIIDYRGDRISLSTQRLFESLNFVAIATSIIWLVPFYFLYFVDPVSNQELKFGFFGWMLIILVTFLIIVILSIIDDLDKPFDGNWTVNVESWTNIIEVIRAEYKELQSTKNTIISPIPLQSNLPIVIPLSAIVPATNGNLQNVGAKSNGIKPRRKKSTPSIAQSMQMQDELPIDAKKPKSTRKIPKGKKGISIIPSTQPQVDLANHEDSESYSI